MFERIILENFRSFDHLEFNLADRSGMPKQLAIIFGDNGVGKTNLTSAFSFLSQSLHTMDVRDLMQSILNENPDILTNEHLSRIIHSGYRDMETLIRENKMVECDDSMKLEFYFMLNEKTGKYLLETNDQQIIHERLEYTLSQNKGVYFDITPEECSINPKVFLDKRTLKEISSSQEKFWGKHSLLSIIRHETGDKAEHLIKDNLSDNFKTVLVFLEKLLYKSNLTGNMNTNDLTLLNNITGNTVSGTIPAEKEETLNKIEKVMNCFFTQINKDIERLFYKKTYKENIIIYKLMIRKKIAKIIRTLDFTMESAGNRSLLRLLPYMLNAAKGSIVVIDEFGVGLHDTLIYNLIDSLSKNLKGQLIISSHGTQIMKNNALKDNIYILHDIDNGEKEINCITYYDKKIGSNTNIRNQFFDGKYGGAPVEASIDFKTLNTLVASLSRPLV